MSFDDLNDLETQTESFPAPSPAFTQLAKSISHRIFTLTSNVALIHRYIGFLDTARDTNKMRSALMDTLEKSKSLSLGLLPEIRELSRWDPEEVGPTESYEQRTLLGDFQKAVTDFQFAQRLALEKQRGFVKDRRKMIEEEQAEYEPSPDGRGERIRRPKEQPIGSDVNAEVALNEQLIAEREHEIQGIEQAIIQMNELFREFGVIITEQASLIGMAFLSFVNILIKPDDFGAHHASATQHLKGGYSEIKLGSRYVVSARKSACYLALILGGIVAIVLFAVHFFLGIPLIVGSRLRVFRSVREMEVSLFVE